MYLSSVYVLARHGFRPRFTAGSVWLGVFVGAHVAAGLDGVGVVLRFAFVVQVAPSIWTVYRQIDLLGSSLLTWSFTLVEGILWFNYGLIQGDAAVTVFGLLAFLAGTLMVARLRKFTKVTTAVVSRPEQVFLRSNVEIMSSTTLGEVSRPERQNRSRVRRPGSSR